MRVLFYNKEPDFTNQHNRFFDGQTGYCLGAAVFWIKQLIAHKNNAVSASASMIEKHRTPLLAKEMSYFQQLYCQLPRPLKANIQCMTGLFQHLGLRVYLLKKYDNISCVFDIPKQQIGHYIIIASTPHRKSGHVVAVSNLGGNMCFFNSHEGIIMSENMDESSQLANLFIETTHFFPKEKFDGFPIPYHYADNKYTGFTVLIQVNFN